MSTNLTPDQIEKLRQLGISIHNSNISNPFFGQILNQTIASNQSVKLLTTPKSPVLPLLSISGLTLFSLGGLILFKTKTESVSIPIPPVRNTEPAEVPTQIPKSIQHHLLASQQYFTQALQLQQSQPNRPNSNELVELLNQSLLAATDAIKSFPADYRGWEQRSRIYQSLIDSQPQLLPNAISDLTKAHQLNPASPELTRSLASLYAKKGDAQNTLAYLSQTVALEPTKAQNFYDLARLQQQAGLLPQALNTYNLLLPLLTDPTQKFQIEAERTTLQNLVSQSPLLSPTATPPQPQPSTIELPDSPPTLQALSDSSLIIAAPANTKDIQVKDQTDSNSLSGLGLIPSGQSQITIYTSRLTSTSQVYVTVTKGNTDTTLQVLSKSSDSFTVGFDSPTANDVEFRWWIIN